MSSIGRALTVFGAVFVIGVILVIVAWTPVPPGEAAVIETQDRITGELQPGWHVLNPVTQDAVYYSTRPRIYVQSGTIGEGEQADTNDAIEAKTVDGNVVFVDVAIRYRITDVQTFHLEWGDWSGQDTRYGKFENEKLRSPVRDDVRDIVGTIDSENVYTGEGQQEIEERLAETVRGELAMGSGAELIEVDIRNVRFSDDYQNQLEAKAVARQEIQVQRANAEAEAESIRIQAEAEAEADRTRSAAIDDKIIAIRQIEAYEDANVVYVPIGEDGLPIYRNVDNSTSP